jgi:Xaa-Pro aminopeptidase
MGFMNFEHARKQMTGLDLDALLLLSSRHFYYATGHSSWFLNLYGEAGYGAAVVPTDPGQPAGALLSDIEEVPFRETAPDFPLIATYPVWIAYGDIPPVVEDDNFAHLASHSQGQPLTRTGQVDIREVVDHLIALLQRMGLEHARIGIELSFSSGSVLDRLQAALPDCHFIDATHLVEQLRAIKSPVEASLLRRGTQLAETAIEDVVADLRSGMTAGEIAQRYRAAVLNHADGSDVLGARITLRVGPHVLSPQSSGRYEVQSGDLVFMDCGVEIAGYWADMGRVFVLGKATPVQKQIYGALRAGFERATALLWPGRPPAEIFSAGLSGVHAAGMTSYIRGNLGHGIGLHRAPELPIISREETLLLAPGQVISVEFPYYLQGIGAFQIEDTFYLNEDGREVFNRLSHDLVEIT